MQTTVLQTILLILLASKFFCEQFLGSLNLKKIKQNKAVIPHSAFDYMNKEEWQKCSNYTIAKIHFSRLENIFSFLLSIIILLFLLPLFYNQWAILYGSGFWVSAIFTATFLILIQQIEMPFDWYRQLQWQEGYIHFNHSLPI